MEKRKRKKDEEEEKEEGNNSKGNSKGRGEFLKCMSVTQIGIRFINGSEEEEILYCEKRSSFERISVNQCKKE